MVFPSVPAYLDPPNWNNQQGQQPRASAGGGDAPLLPVGPAAATAAGPDNSGLPSSSSTASAAVAAQARPNSMAERARLARMPQPEQALKCPRCDSTNTKFCYYNNYSLSQPRHFCKACRRYWTRGGSLRNVPVGGGCRRNKRSSKSSGGSSSSKPYSSARQLAGPSSSTPSSTPGATGAIIPPSLGSFSHHLPFLGTMHQPGPNLGLAFSAGLPPLGMQHMDTVDQFPVASGGGATIGASLEQWRVQQQPQQQFPFLTGGGILELPPPAMYQLGLDGNNRGGSGSAAAAAFTLGQTSATTARQEGSMKVEGSKGQDMSLQRQYMAALRHGSQGVWDGIHGNAGSSGGDGGGNGGSSWPMNIPGFHSSSTGGGNGSGL
ncbi:hypothetical protein SEVIR_9G455900v4 [Setaria viridis]|uniref:Dof zinc finger protein n=2 Tax=Setaria TaxID=4554 RepID=K4ABE0_SETIT|nr:dof zinc finger protein DOF3.6 isoform X2 [Setaria italica]XP_034577300.1 dof zinc finger protein DOF3.6-like isoform X2 [Setaria viridis]RCV45413.1 hypothetical protein SETIT_9G452000v2 [Setaria italica]TKV96839.1 hypothetical protein SEVIR_9G455900v2 [Setaria viridis]